MIICALRTNDGIQNAIIEGTQVYSLEGSLSAPSRGKKIGPLDESRLLPPVVPTKIVCVGRNYAAHAREHGAEVPTEPLLFLKPPSALIGHGAAIMLYPGMGRVEHEAELAIVIGRQGFRISQQDALGHVLGYTCANDVSARDFQAKDGQWTRSKGFDTFCPLGPWIVTGLDPSNLQIRCTVNQEVRQQGNTHDMVFDPATLISHVSTIMTLYPGDVILTGTPAGVGPISAGDIVEVEIAEIGTLRNPVMLADLPVK